MFKVGDEVFDNERGYGEGVVSDAHADWIVVNFVKGIQHTYTQNGEWHFNKPITLFKKEEKMKTYTLEQFKKFAKEIEAYENGEEIQALYLDEWQDCVPKWDIHCKYRVKPKLSREEITANWVKENNLKVGDRVKVLRGFDNGFGGLNKGQSDYCIGKIGTVEEVTNKGIELVIDYDIWTFPVECLEKVKEEYVPFDVEDFHLFRDKWLRFKIGDKVLVKIQGFSPTHKSIYLINNLVSLDAAFEELEFEDGTPFGKLKL